MARIVFKCEFCGKIHDEEQEALDCEIEHVNKGEVCLLHGEEIDVGLLGRWPDKLLVVAGDKGCVFGRTGDFIPSGEILKRVKRELEERGDG